MAISVYDQSGVKPIMVEVNFFSVPSHYSSNHYPNYPNHMNKLFREICKKLKWYNELYIWFYTFTNNVTVEDINKHKSYKIIYQLRDSINISQIIVILINYLKLLQKDDYRVS